MLSLMNIPSATHTMMPDLIKELLLTRSLFHVLFFNTQASGNSSWVVWGFEALVRVKGN